MRSFNRLKIVLIGLFSIVSTTSCFMKDHVVKEDGLFKYVITGDEQYHPKNNKDRRVAIVDLLITGKEATAIEIPKLINGIPVKYLGYYPIKRREIPNLRGYKWESDNLKKIFIYENVKRVYDSTFSLIRDGKGANIMVCEYRSYGIGESYATSEFSTTYIYRELFDKALEEQPEQFSTEWTKRQNIKPGNVAFLNNYSQENNGGYYRVDNVENGETLATPPTIVREGFNFTNWYTEPECLNIFNFDIAPVIAEDEELRLYAGWEKV